YFPARDRTTGSGSTGILAFFATLPGGQLRATFTMPRQRAERDRCAFDERSSSVDFLPMTLRTRFLITALFLCHHLLAPSLVTSQLLAGISDSAADQSTTPTRKDVATAPLSTPCAKQAGIHGTYPPVICAIEQEKVGDVYKLHGNAEIYYRTYVLRADEATYDSDSGEATASGHFTLDGGPN